MKKWFVMAVCFGLATGMVSAAEKAFYLATCGDVDAALAGEVRDYLTRNAGVEVRALDVALPGDVAETLDGMGRAAIAAAPADMAAVVVLARPAMDAPQGVCLPKERLAVLNLNKLSAAGDAAKLSRRVGQEGLRVMAMLMDMSPCPFPLCVLVGYEKVEDLDQMSGNFCPPCQDRFRRLAEEKGLAVVPVAE